MANELIISVSGLRGIVGDTLTDEVAFRYAAAFAATLPAGPVVVTRDGRANGPLLVEPVVAGLSQGGSAKVFDAGIAATPTTGVLVREHHWAGGVQISASHNPAAVQRAETVLGRGTRGAGGGRRARCWSGTARWRQAAIRRKHPSQPNRLAIRCRHIWSSSSRLSMCGGSKSRRFRVLLDANHGSGSVLGKPLLERLGCDVKLGGEARRWPVRACAGADGGESGAAFWLR